MDHSKDVGPETKHQTLEVALEPHSPPLGHTVVDEQWESLRSVEDGSRPQFETRFRFARTNQALVLDIVANSEQLTTRSTRRNDPLHEDDVVELFLDPTGDGRCYLELQASPAGVLFEAWVHNRTDFSVSNPQRDLEISFNREGPDSPKVSVLLDGRAPDCFTAQQFRQGVPVQQWRTRFEIPYVALPAQKSTRPWRANVFRIQATAGEREYQAWKPTGLVDFHRPHCFGELHLGSFTTHSHGVT